MGRSSGQGGYGVVRRRSAWLAIIGVVLLLAGCGGPSISSISPGNAVTGDTITITGQGFDPERLDVRIDGQEAHVVSATKTTIVVVVPTGVSKGAVTVYVGSTGVTGHFDVSGTSSGSGSGSGSPPPPSATGTVVAEENWLGIVSPPFHPLGPATITTDLSKFTAMRPMLETYHFVGVTERTFSGGLLDPANPSLGSIDFGAKVWVFPNSGDATGFLSADEKRMLADFSTGSYPIRQTGTYGSGGVELQNKFRTTVIFPIEHSVVQIDVGPFINTPMPEAANDAVALANLIKARANASIPSPPG